MAALVTREEVREENRRVLKILIGIALALVAVALITIIVTH